MSKDERKFDSFAEIFSDEEENTSVLESLRRAPAGSNVQYQLARGNVGDASNEPAADLFHRTSGLRNPICSDMGAEGGQNVVRSSENVQQSAEYSLLQPASNKRNISDTNDSSTECSVWNKKTCYCQMNLNESRCQLFDLSIREASYKTDGIRDGEINSCQKNQSSTSASSEEYSSLALSSFKTKGQRKIHVCDVCKREFPFLSKLEAHMRTHTDTILNIRKNAPFVMFISTRRSLCNFINVKNCSNVLSVLWEFPATEGYGPSTLPLHQSARLNYCCNNLIKHIINTQ
ncbi:hypothetical protein CEXT_266101 [Caerostris extrusa]|uniref:C2H2-type domain-containing protein n=1 Tax=Caerostris extrusa TaxID=172846 RepID=A0AAV4TY58_CAEEX|nr:hypothetical protein CEXT_266101 [Caerostris extrusa]